MGDIIILHLEVLRSDVYIAYIARKMSYASRQMTKKTYLRDHSAPNVSTFFDRDTRIKHDRRLTRGLNLVHLVLTLRERMQWVKN